MTVEDSSTRITVDPAVCHGKPIIRGLRYPVEMIRDLMSGGMTDAEIIDDFPDLEPADLEAVRRTTRAANQPTSSF